MTASTEPPHVEALHDAWRAYGDASPIAAVFEVSANVSTNRVYRVVLVDGRAYIAKVSSYGSYFLFAEDHDRLYRMAQLLRGTRFDGLLADVLGVEGRAFTWYDGTLWAAFYAEVERHEHHALTADNFVSEPSLVLALENVLEELNDLSGTDLSDPYFLHLESLISKFSLRYELRRPCLLCPTLPGIFSNLIRDLRTHTNTDAHLFSLMNDFESSVRDIRTNNSASHFKTCIQKQVNLLEALGGQLPAVSGNTLGQICNQAKSGRMCK